MDFTAITRVTIPEGNVVMIRSGSRILWNHGLLPTGYRQLKYIETTGSEYINTGILASAYPGGLQYRFHGCITGFLQSTGNNYLFGCLHLGRRSGNVSANTGSDTLCVYAGGNSMQILTTDLPHANTDFILTLNACSTEPENAEATLNNIAFTKNEVSEPTEMPQDNIYLLWCSGVGETSKPFLGKLYGFQINSSDGTALRDFVPCRRVEDGTIGLFDTVDNQFYANAGSGAFSGGE